MMYKAPSQTIEARVVDLLGRMTLEEKVGQLTQFDGRTDVFHSGHAGGDLGLVESLYYEMLKDKPGDMSSSISQSIESHIIGFAAEETRITGKTVVIEEFLKQL